MFRTLLRREPEPTALDFFSEVVSRDGIDSMIDSVLATSEFEQLLATRGVFLGRKAAATPSGQLDSVGQRELRDKYQSVRADECEFYHSMTFDDGTEHTGAWDLRGREVEYVGSVSLNGARVIDYGPASGWLTFWMERQGAEVVAFEVGAGSTVDVIPSHSSDPVAFRR